MKLRGGPAASSLDLVAYRIGDLAPMEIVPASRTRSWMDGSDHARLAQLCLPMAMANQLGWQLLNPIAFRCRWDGGADIAAVRVEPLTKGEPVAAFSSFGHGALAWVPPFVFRTPRDWGLLVKAPANQPKAGATALEGYIETAWHASTFHVVWHLTRPGRWVTFAAGEPVAQILPIRACQVEEFMPIVRDLGDDPEIEAEYRTWRAKRVRLMGRIGSRVPEPGEMSLDYMAGRTSRGAKAPPGAHRTKLRLAPF